MSETNPHPNIGLARHIVEYLKTRHHVEAPHISLLSPEYTVVARIKGFLDKTTIKERGKDRSADKESEEGEGEFTSEFLADLLDPMKIRGHATHGVRATFRGFKVSSEVQMETSFYIRTAPPDEFRRIKIIARLKKDCLKVKFVAEAEDGREVYSTKWLETPINKNPFRAVIAVGQRGIADKAAEIVSQILYPDAVKAFLEDPNIVKNLSTKTTRDDEPYFFYHPSLKKGVTATSKDYFAVQNILYEVEFEKMEDEVKVSFVLRYIAPALIRADDGKIVRTGRELGFPTFVYIGNHRNRWSIHHLFEVESRLQWKDVESVWSWTRSFRGQRYSGLYGLTPVGALAVEDEKCRVNANCLLLRDWHIDTEMIYPVKRSRLIIDQSFDEVGRRIISDFRERGGGIDEHSLKDALDLVRSALRESFPKVEHLYKFQEKALYEGLKALLSGEHRAFILQARTAGGKTLAFLLPILAYITYTKLTQTSEKGVKALLFYPTIALQNDQSATIFKMLWHLNERLYIKTGKVVSLGMLHSHTPSRHDAEKGCSREEELRLRCPVCGSRLLLSWEKIPRTGICREVVRCSEPLCTMNDPASFKNTLLRKMIKTSRDSIYSDPPDLLIANPDIINARLTLMGREDPASLTLFGKAGYICRVCGRVHDTRKKPLKCHRCSSKELYEARFTYPKIIVIDEAHLLRGAFGAQVSHVLTRLEQVIRKLNSLPDEWRPIYFVSSATLNNPKNRAKELIATPVSNITEISAEPESPFSEPTLRTHVFVMPKLYSPEATVSRIVEALYLDASALVSAYKKSYNKKLNDLQHTLFADRKPATLTFVNKIAEANELLSFLRSVASDVRSDGHTTDFQRYRVQVEDRFSRGELDLIVATRGLEVGVDFNRVDVGIIYGMPFYLSDYTQRIGRIGRNQHCIVFNIFRPDKPIDHFYYRNWKLLSDGELRDEHMRGEAYRINRENPEAVRKSAQRTVLDMLSTETGMETVLSHSISAQEGRYQPEVMGTLNSIEQKAEAYLSKALKIPDVQSAVGYAVKFIEKLKELLTVHGTLFKAVKQGYNADMSQLRSLRSLEPEVKYKFNPLVGQERERSRNMIYAFRHVLRGQIISYRSNFYTVELSIGSALPSREEAQ